MKKIGIEKIYDRGSHDVNEDELLAEGNLFAVFDGATSLGKAPFINQEGKSGGKIAAEIAKQTFLQQGSLKTLAIKANQRIQTEMNRERIDISQKEGRWASAAAVLRLLNGELEFFQIGDSLILAIYQDGSYKLITEHHDHDTETLMAWKILAERKERDIREKLRSQNIKVRREANIKYGVLNGEETAVNFFNLGRASLEGIKSLILFTDGLMIPKENPQDPEDWPLFVQLYKQGGLAAILNHIRSLEKGDPNCWQYPRTKQYDDIAAVSIVF